MKYHCYNKELLDYPEPHWVYYLEVQSWLKSKELRAYRRANSGSEFDIVHLVDGSWAPGEVTAAINCYNVRQRFGL
jgi:hypothetical protein